jgi:micrococcal nuclease
MRTTRAFVPILIVMVLLAASVPGVAAPPLPVTLVAVSSPVSHGHAASLSVQTVPGAACAITVTYKSGPSRAKGLTPKTADSQGMVRWTWIVGTRTTPGNWPIQVSCSAGGRHGALRTSFVVQ